MREQDFDKVEGYEVPVDPMDELQCDSCQQFGGTTQKGPHRRR